MIVQVPFSEAKTSMTRPSAIRPIETGASSYLSSR